MKQDPNNEDSDQVISAIGDFGPWQLKFVSLLAFTTLFSAVPSLIIKFMNAPNQFVCADPFQEQLAPPLVVAEQVSNLQNVSYGPDSCRVWDSPDPLNYDNATGSNSTHECSDFAYDNSEWYVTIINQYDLVCDRSHLKDLAQTFFFGGMMVGIYFWGYCSDK